MSYDYYLDQCHEEYYREDEYCDDCGDVDDFDADDYEVCFDNESGELEVVR